MLRFFVGVSFAWLLNGCATPGANLTIKNGNEVIQFRQGDLLKSKDLQEVRVVKDPAYQGRPMSYSAVPLSEVFKGIQIKSDQTLQFKCLDGFSGPLHIERALQNRPKQARAYLAIENPEHKWPALKAGSHATAGPFYLIWENPELSEIKIEEWPYQLASLEIRNSIEVEFPKIVPRVSLTKDSTVLRGYRLFVQNCFACHTLNGEGQSQLGPDLNIPKSPTEYFKSNYLTSLLRNPQNLHSWPQGKMKGFDSTQLKDAELQDIIKYLEHMAKIRE